MKKTLFTVLLLISSLSYSQEQSIKAFGDVQFGAATTMRGNAILNTVAGFNFATKGGLYLRLGGDLGFYGRRFDPYIKSSYVGYNLRLGYASVASKSITIVPYIGIGMENGVITTYQLDVLANATSNLTNGAISSVTGNSKTTRSKYLTEKESYVTVPMGVDIHFHTKNVGLVLGYYVNASKYVEGGIRVGLTFGKL